jgi:hyperosmotically inducible protein
MRRLLSVLVAIAGVVAPAAALAQISDRELGARIAETIINYPYYSVFDSVEVNVENRTVTLLGRVTTPRKKEDIEKRVMKIDGIRALANEIGVLPVSQSDDNLRYRVARAIYGHTMFWMYAQMPVPPVHIIVERGRITLTGTVETEVQRSLAGTLAQVGGNFGVTNRIRVERPR